MKKKLLILVGPTAVGKTETSFELARRLNGEIVSADSIQIYQYMDIGTAKPTLQEREEIPHHLIDIVKPNENFSVAEYQVQAKEAIDTIIDNGKLPIVVGGTGLYINSLIYKMDFTSTVSNWDLRNQLQWEAEMYGNHYLHNKLKEINPEAANRIHPNNVKRVIRAIEVYYENGETIGDFSRDLQLNDEYDWLLIVFTRDREELYERINVRVDKMIEEGLVEEVEQLLEMGYPEDLVAFKGLGYKEIINYLKGRYGFDEAVRILKRDTRRYAKRQLTWFRRYRDLNLNMKWFNLSHYQSKEKLIDDIMKHIGGHFNFL